MMNDLTAFTNMSTYRLASKETQTQVEIKIFMKTFLLCGVLLCEHTDNYAFEITSRLLPLYGFKSHTTDLIDQCDEQGPQHCALIVPYNEMSPPGDGLIFSMHKHTLPVVDLDLTKSQNIAISLSDKIIITNMQTVETATDIKLPKINEPYLNCTTLPRMLSYFIKKDDESSSDDESEAEKAYQHYAFLVNSLHHVYLVTGQEDIRLHRTSEKGFLTAEVIDKLTGLSVFVENNSKTIEFWNLGQNKLHSKIDVNVNAYVKRILLAEISPTILIAILTDGTMLFYVFTTGTFIHRGTFNAGKHLGLVVADFNQLICTFDSTTPVDFVHIDLNPFCTTEKVLLDNDIVKTVIAFDPPITPKPIQQIVFPDGKVTLQSKKMKIFFLATTKEALYVVHVCCKQNISYVCIPGRYDVLSLHYAHLDFILATQRGILNAFQWKCLDGEDNNHDQCTVSHKHRLFVSFDISSSSILTLRPSPDSGKQIFLFNLLLA
mgnify:FL=1